METGGKSGKDTFSPSLCESSRLLPDSLSKGFFGKIFNEEKGHIDRFIS